MSYAYSSQPRRGSGRGWLIGLVVIAAAVYGGIRYFNDQNQSNYTEGHQAYQKSDCEGAISHFDRINSWWLVDRGGYAALAQQEFDECILFQQGVD